MHFEAAPWSTALKVVSLAATIGVAAVCFAIVHTVPHGKQLVIVPIAILFMATLFVVNGYAIDRDRLYVQRLLWRTAIPLDGLTRAWHDPAAMKGSLRVIGNGGMFGITGIFQNAALGRYRAFVTDSRQAVVLQWPARVVVLSPAHPRAFLGELHLLHPHIAAV